MGIRDGSQRADLGVQAFPGVAAARDQEDGQVVLVVDLK
jgi:hypothetical protein